MPKITNFINEKGEYDHKNKLVDKWNLVWINCLLNNADIRFYNFDAPEHKQATYAQCSRLFAACLDLPEDEVLITSDVDMCLFRLPIMRNAITGEYDFPFFEVIGVDLVPPNQFAICYLSAQVRRWRKVFELQDKTYQQCLDELLGGIEAEHLKGNYWAKDQEEAYNHISKEQVYRKGERAKEGTQFATKRYDRDDAFLLERLSPDTIDYHLPRPGYEENNFNQILTVLKYHYPDDNFDWLINYKNAYKELL